MHSRRSRNASSSSFSLSFNGKTHPTQCPFTCFTALLGLSVSLSLAWCSSFHPRVNDSVKAISYFFLFMLTFTVKTFACNLAKQTRKKWTRMRSLDSNVTLTLFQSTYVKSIFITTDRWGKCVVYRCDSSTSTSTHYTRSLLDAIKDGDSCKWKLSLEDPRYRCQWLAQCTTATLWFGRINNYQ